jgi:hypothetical protein
MVEIFLSTRGATIKTLDIVSKVYVHLRVSDYNIEFLQSKLHVTNKLHLGGISWVLYITNGNLYCCFRGMNGS